MANAAGDAHECPIYGAHFRVAFPILDADGDLVPGAAGLDSERSIDHGTFADCTNEATEIATSSGMYYLDLTGAEMTGKCTAVIVKTTTTGAKTTPIVLYPRRLPVLESGAAQAGAAGTITLASGASAKDGFYVGCFVLITNDNPAGSQYQARKIISYVGSTRVATIESNWGTNPGSSSTYDILVPETVSVAAWAGKRVEDWNTAGRPTVDVLSFATGAIDSAAISSAAANKLADHAIRRSFANARASSDGDAKSYRSLLGAVAKLVNKIAPSGANLQVFEEDDSTVLGTQAITTDAAAQPVTALDTI